jgi:hypothetical protein
MPASPNKIKREWSKTVGAIAALVLALLMFVGFIMLFGAVRGEEFSPTSFARRSFVFYRIPLIRVQVTPVIRKSITNPLELHLENKRFVKIDSRAKDESAAGSDGGAAKQRWDIVHLTPLSRPKENGAASCLCAYLDRPAQGGLKWLQWTKSHPRLARRLWPIVRQSAIDRLYFCVPDLMVAAEEAAERNVDATVLKGQLESIAREAATVRNRAVSSDR